jgi:hypothetical protein
MGLARFRWRRLAGALGISFGIELLEVICVVGLLPPRWAGAIGDLPLQPASYLVSWLARTKPAGFEGQVGYFLLALTLQWLIYSAVVYVLLAISWTKPISDGAAKEISHPSRQV